MSTPARLSELPTGGRAVIKSLPTGSPLLTRLRELGLLPGTAVRLVRRAPMGDPIQICLRGSHLSLRQREAEQVEITVE